MNNDYKEKFMKKFFLVAACTSVLCVALMCFFLFANGLPGMLKIGISKFILGTRWAPSNNLYGILPMVLGSIYITIGSLLIGVPVGLMTAVFLNYYCPKKLYPLCKTTVDLLAGIPSVIYGFFGIVVLVPFIREVGKITGFGGNGSSIITASILLGIMILPTIIGVAQSSIKAVPKSYYEGSVALGATKERTIFSVMIPAAKSGVIAAIVLGIGRTIGETMAVIMVAGNQARIPDSLFKGIRTLTANIVLEMGYATDLHREALIATAVILFIFILIINLCVALLKRRNKFD